MSIALSVRSQGHLMGQYSQRQINMALALEQVPDARDRAKALGQLQLFIATIAQNQIGGSAGIDKHVEILTLRQ